MSRFALPHPLPILGILAFVAACTDANSPDPHASLRPGSPTPALEGNLPPPPTRTAITVEVSTGTGSVLTAALSSQVCTFAFGQFEGAYFSNGKTVESAAAAQQLADPSLAFEGTAWLRIDNAQPSFLQTSASANARFQRTDQKFSGKGTLVFPNGCVVVITEVTNFISFPSCTIEGQPCAEIEFSGTIGDLPFTEGHVEAFNIESCDPFDGGEGSPGGFDCGS